MLTRFIGDIHGNYQLYAAMIDCDHPTIQIGDFGIGFVENHTDQKSKDKFIRGNHDNPALCREEPNWIEDGTFENGMFFIGGANSIDKEFRTPGISWWEDEELSLEEFHHIQNSYCDVKPNIMVTHDCPQLVAQRIHEGRMLYPSRTGNMLEGLLYHHMPKLWIFGHHHVDFQVRIGDTHFICVDQNSSIDIDLQDYL